MIGQFGHCNQDLVNLLLSGKAISNVMDGDIPLGDSGLVVKGMKGQTTIGYLTHLEALRFCQVPHTLHSWLEVRKDASNEHAMLKGRSLPEGARSADLGRWQQLALHSAVLHGQVDKSGFWVLTRPSHIC